MVMCAYSEEYGMQTPGVCKVRINITTVYISSRFLELLILSGRANLICYCPTVIREPGACTSPSRSARLMHSDSWLIHIPWRVPYDRAQADPNQAASTEVQHTSNLLNPFSQYGLFVSKYAEHSNLVIHRIGRTKQTLNLGFQTIEWIEFWIFKNFSFLF